MRKLRYTIGLLLIAFCSTAQTAYFTYNGAADVNFSYPPRGSGGRAIVHADGNVLNLNYGGDFTGGTRIGNGLFVGNEGSLIIPQGNVGIGTTNPVQPLTIPITSNAQGVSLGTYSSLSAGQFAFIGITGADGTFNGGNLSNGDNGSTGMAIVHTSGGTGNSAELAFVTHNNGLDSRERLRIDRLGNVGIGTTTPSEKLSVNGKIRAQEIKVETANWPDYVFEKSYELPSLSVTEKHIKEKGHLPGIPSAAEVKANGIDLGDMNAKLLQKIEELTLHLIKMGNDNEGFKKQINHLEKENLSINKKLDALVKDKTKKR